MPLMRNFFLSLSRSERLRRVATGFGPARAMAHRWVAGETLEEALEGVRVLNRDGILATLDHLGENVTSEHEARDATTEIIDLVEGIAAHDLRSGVSVKLTQLGLDLGPALAAENLERIVARAAEVDRFVRIDMEGYDYLQTTLDLFDGLWPRYQNVGLVVQSYLYRSADDVALLIDMGVSVRLVKGAYDEPPEVAFPDKADTDANYVCLMEQLFSDKAQANGVFPAIATHDEHLIAWAREHARERQISPERFEFQMLYGIRPGLQHQLVADGYRVRAYVPYGRQWFPYFMRRLAERPANVVFLARNMFRA